MSWQELPLDRIYFDSVTGVPGITWPIGTPGVPSGVIADVILMCGARNLNSIDVRGVLTLGDDMVGYDFKGHYFESLADYIDLSAEDVSGSRFEDVVVAGLQGGTGLATYVRCILYTLTGFRGLAENCPIYGDIGIAAGALAFADFDACSSIHSDVTMAVGNPERLSIKDWKGNLTLSGQAAGAGTSLAFVRGFDGDLVIDAMTGGTLDIFMRNGTVTINATCTGGAINIYGSAIVTDNSGATVVNDHTLETAKVEAYGTADAGDADTLVDDALTQGDDYWKGLTLLMITGANAGLTRPIVAFTALGDTMELRPAFPAAIAAGDVYAILSNYHEVVPGVDSAENYLPRDVIGNKEDVANETVAEASIIGLLRAILADTSTTLEDKIDAISGAMALEATLGTHDTDIKALLDTIAGYLDTEIAAILADVTGIAGAAMRGTDGAALASAWTAVLATALAAYTALRGGYLDELGPTNIPADIDGLKTSRDSQLFTMDFWSDPQEEVQLGAGAASLVFTPTVTVADLPGDATIVRAVAMFKFRMVENTYNDVNSLDGPTDPLTSQVIQIKEAGGAYIDAINFVDLQFTLASETREGGDVLIGSINIVGEVDVNGVYTFRWFLGKAAHDSINFNDCAVGIRILYSV